MSKLSFKEAPLEIIDGDRGRQYPKKSEMASHGFCLFLSAANVTKTGFNFDVCEFITQEKDQVLRKGKLRRNDVVLTTRGTLGNVAYYGDSVKYEHLRINSGMVIFRCNKDRLRPEYLYSYIRSDLFRNQIEMLRSGAAQPQLPIRDINRIQLIIPPLPTQHRIADILSAYDDLIENNNRRMALLEESIHLLYKEWFVYLRFPGHEHTKIVDGVPEGWEETTVEDAFSYLGGGTPRRAEPDYWRDGTINWYSPSDLTKAKSLFMSESSEQINRTGLAKSSARLFPEYSVMMTSRATIGEIAINTTPATTNQGFITCIPNGNVPLYYLYGWLSANIARFKARATGTTFKELSKGRFKTISFILPPQDLTARFNLLVTPTAQKIRNCQQQNQKLREARDLLLPRLVDGRISV